MNLFTRFLLFCHFIIATQLENRNHLNDGKNGFKKLHDGHVYGIYGYLDDNGKEQLSKASRDLFKFDPRVVSLKLPLTNSKQPIEFVCDHLKIRKKLVISLKENFEELGSSSLEMKYLKCLSGIETLQFGEYTEASKILSNPAFNLHELFPRLNHLEFALNDGISTNVIPNHLKALKLYLKSDYSKKEKLKEKIAHMQQLEWFALNVADYSNNGVPALSSYLISILNRLPSLQRLDFEFDGKPNDLRDILPHTENTNYYLDLKLMLSDMEDINVDLGEVVKYLPKKTEKLFLQFIEFKETEKFCESLPAFNHLKTLEVDTMSISWTFNCLLYSLPHSLTELSFNGRLDNADGKKISLPNSLHTAHLREVSSNVFEAFANHVLVLDLKVTEPEHILKIQNPFTRVRSLIFSNDFPMFEMEVWFHLLNLLPMDMDFVEIKCYLKNEKEDKAFKEKILSLRKRIKHFNLVNFSSSKNLITEFIYKESKSKMIMKN